jgi:hypothetical protein
VKRPNKVSEPPIIRRPPVPGSGTVPWGWAAGEFKVIASDRELPLILMLILRLETVGSRPAARPGPGVYNPSRSTSRKSACCVMIDPEVVAKDPKLALLSVKEAKLVRFNVEGPKFANSGTGE